MQSLSATVTLELAFVDLVCLRTIQGVWWPPDRSSRSWYLRLSAGGSYRIADAYADTLGRGSGINEQQDIHLLGLQDEQRLCFSIV